MAAAWQWTIGAAELAALGPQWLKWIGMLVLAVGVLIAAKLVKGLFT